jgi:CDP-6-deoxy-D-xylo-4-hexulose-3-dehydrase
MGELTIEFEKQFAEWQGRKYAVMVNSGSSANLILIQALKNLEILKEKDKVAFSGLTWSTNIMPIIQMGFEPIPIDIDKETLNINMNDLFEKANGIKCLFLTNVLGFMPKDYHEIKMFCEDRNILLLEDCCESINSEIKAINDCKFEHALKVGNLGEASTFSFYCAHPVSTIEGGMIVTDDKNLYDMIKVCRAHGWIRNLDEKKKKKLKRIHCYKKDMENYTFIDLGYNLRPTEINAFLGLCQLPYFEEIANIRQSNFIEIMETYEQNEDFIKFDYSHLARICNFAIPLLCKTEQIKNKYLKRFEQNGIETRSIIAGDITLQPFWKKYIKKDYYLKNTRFIHHCGFYFANNTDLTKEDLNLIKSCLI